jgi:hypothetical protein
MKLQTYIYKNIEYTVDYRLQQFRSCEGGWESLGEISFIEFDSELGDEILAEMIKDGVEQRFNTIIRK